MRFHLTVLIATALILASPVYATNFSAVIQMYNSASAGGGSETIGVTSIGENDTGFSTGDIRCSAMDAPSGNGTITSIYIYSVNTEWNLDVKVGVYQDDGTGILPETKIGTETEFVDHGTWSLGWEEFSGLSHSVSSGVNYWLCTEVSKTGMTMYYTSGGASSRVHDANTYGDAWSATFVEDNNSTALYSMKATVEF